MTAVGDRCDLLVSIGVGVCFLLIILFVFHVRGVPVGSSHLGGALNVLELALVVVIGCDPVGCDTAMD
jgi:hypothetical protein